MVHVLPQFEVPKNTRYLVVLAHTSWANATCRWTQAAWNLPRLKTSIIGTYQKKGHGKGSTPLRMVGLQQEYVCFTSLFACSMSFLLRGELPHIRGVGSACPAFFKSCTATWSSWQVPYTCTCTEPIYVRGWYTLCRVHYWQGFKFGDVLTIRQTTKLKSSPNFPTIRSCTWTVIGS